MISYCYVTLGQIAKWRSARKLGFCFIKGIAEYVADTHFRPQYTLIRKQDFFCFLSVCLPVTSGSVQLFFSFFLIVCFTSYFVFSIAVLPHSAGVVYYHLLLRRKTRVPKVAPFSFRIGIWDLFVHRGQKSYTPMAFGKLWTTPGVRCMKHASS